MAKQRQIRTHELLESIVNDFDRRKSEAEAMLTGLGIDVELVYSISPPKQVNTVCTFEKRVSRPLSPMLSERFDFASEIVRGLDVWVGEKQMQVITRSKQLRLTHRSLRQHWINSAPALYKDSSLSLFGYTIDVPENIVYLAWTDKLEPEVYVYAGQTEEHYNNLDEYLQWCLSRP